MKWFLLVIFLISQSSTLPQKSLFSTLFDKDVENNFDEQTISQMIDKVSMDLETEYEVFLKTGREGQMLKDLAEHHSENIMRYEIENMGVQDRIFTCTLCRSTLNVAMRTIRENEVTENEARDFIYYVCRTLHIYTMEFCEGFYNLNYEIVEFIIKETNVTSRDVCGVMLQASVCSINTSPSFNFKINIDQLISGAAEPKSSIPEPGQNDFRILQLTDIHYDPLYSVGSLASCNDIMCCRGEVVTNTSQQAGYWTDYRDCDIPRYMIEDAYQHITETHENLDYIYFTGDVIDHAVWLTSYDHIKSSLRDQYSLLKEYFKVPLFPAIGNHESQPLNQFAPNYITDERFSTKWLYDILADIWIQDFNLPKETSETIRKGGYYTVSPHKGFRVITLNNNDCYTFNWWIFYDPAYLSEQLQWFHDVLKKAEDDGEFVHVLAHIPSGAGSCWNIWSREYTRIIERFRNTISGVFNGHTHLDEMNVFYSEEGNHAINVGWNGGSLTPFSYTNPNYRIYTCDEKEMQVLDHETWIFNLTEANIFGPEKRPVWFQEYSFKEYFNLKDLSPKSIDELFERFARQPDLLLEYHNLKRNMADPSLEKPCDDQCLKKDLCDLVVTTFKNKKRCKELLAIYDGTVAPTTSSQDTTISSEITDKSTAENNPTTENLPTTTCDPSDPDCDGAISISSISFILTISISLVSKILL